MHHYRNQTSKELARELKDKGMPLELTTECLDSIIEVEDGIKKYYALPTYAEIFDWLLDKGINLLCRQSGKLWYVSINDEKIIYSGEVRKEVVDEGIRYILKNLNEND